MNPLSSSLRFSLVAWGLAAMSTAQQTGANLLSGTVPLPQVGSQSAERIRQSGTGTLPDHVVFDHPGDGRIWALGHTYKASFGPDGFVYVPFFGSDAPRNYPVRFVLRAVRVGGQALPVAGAAPAALRDAQVTFHRGPVREVYDLTTDGVEQTFVVDGDLPGDVEIELEVLTELVEDAARDGLQFGNALGHVEYGTAYLVQGGAKAEIPASFAGRALSLRVPAGMRGPGPVVVDPIIRTRPLTQSMMTSDLPDVAYDVTNDCWAAVWVHDFSSNDADIVGELRNSAGEAITGSFRAIETSTEHFARPRIANLNSADRFLVAMERFQPQSPAPQYTVWGRTWNAAAPFTLGSLTEISPPASAEQNAVDVGGDPGDGTLWTVLWVHGNDIHARQIEANGTPRPTTIPIETTAAPSMGAQISLSNGNGLTTRPGWCITYMTQASINDWDIYGAFLTADGFLTRIHVPLGTAPTNDLNPYVSSPLTDVGSTPAFMLSYERQTLTGPEMVVRVFDDGFSFLTPEISMTRRYGFGGTNCRVETDGSRFAATCRLGSQMSIATLAFVGNDVVVHEALQGATIGVNPNLASKRAGGGISADYAMVCTGTSTTPFRAQLTIYLGHAQSGGFTPRPTGCGPTLVAEGEPILGRSVQFTLADFGSDLPFLLLGLPAPAVLLCSNCSVGLDLTQALIPFASPMTLPLPTAPTLVGATFAVQGFAIGSGPCAPAAIRTSITLDVTVQ